MSDYRCDQCGDLLEVKPDIMHTDSFVVAPCEKCANPCNDCLLFDEED